MSSNTVKSNEFLMFAFEFEGLLRSALNELYSEEHMNNNNGILPAEFAAKNTAAVCEVASKHLDFVKEQYSKRELFSFAPMMVVTDLDEVRRLLHEVMNEAQKYFLLANPDLSSARSVALSNVKYRVRLVNPLAN